jgi:TonB family protein
VILESKEVFPSAPHADTDRNGRYRIEGIPPGRYFVGANTGTGPIILFPGTVSEKIAKLVTVKSGGTIKGVDLSLPALSVKGRVLSTRQAAPGFSMQARLVPQNEFLSGVVIVRAHLNTFIERDGSFVFLNVAPGTYSLQTSPMRPVRDVPVVVSDRDLTGIGAEIPAAREVTVRVTAPAGAKNNLFLNFSLINEDRRIPVAVGRNPTSQSVFSMILPEGENRLEASVPGYSVVSMTHESTDLLQNPFRLAAKGSAEIRITLAASQPASPPTNPRPAAGLVTVDPQVLAGICEACPPPAYPSLARVARVVDTVKVAIVVGQDGRVRETRLVSGHALLQAAVIDAVRLWRFAPLQMNGNSVDFQSTVSVVFME